MPSSPRHPLGPAGLLWAVVVLVALVATGPALGAGTAPPPRRQAVTAPGTLAQLPRSRGCLVDRSTSKRGCTAVRALAGPGPFLGSRAVAIDPKGKNVYVASSGSNAIAIFQRNARTGQLAQPAGAGGCIGGAPADGCAPGLALSAPEGLAISSDANTVYVAAAVSNAVGVLTRDAATGALTQATDGTGCIVQGALAGCTTGTQLAGANAVTVSADDSSVYVTSLLSNSVTSFTRTATTGALAQKTGTAACVVFLLANGCSLGRVMNAPEGLAVSPDGGEVYVAAFTSGAIDTLTRKAQSGALMQKPRRAGCVVVAAASDCVLGRALSGAGSIVVSPDGRNVYSTAFSSDALGVFKRVTRGS